MCNSKKLIFIIFIQFFPLIRAIPADHTNHRATTPAPIGAESVTRPAAKTAGVASRDISRQG